MVDCREFDWKQFDAYRRENVESHECNSPFADGATVLKVWEEAKNRYLAKLFPEHQLVMERPISYEKDQDEMRRDFGELHEEFHSFYWSFREKLAAAMDPAGHYHDYHYRREHPEFNTICQCMEMMYSWMNFDRLYENTIEFPWEWRVSHINRYEADIMGHKIMLQPGMKLMKTWGKICGWLGLGEEFEQFRIRQSQLTNTKKVSGTICLSIHPLDYATASDNENGWSSCMSWREHGCYRMGTVEMMNSPMVICSYLKSNKAEMSIDGQEWNSKKWRAWVIVTHEGIVMNRQYPYHSDAIGEAVCRWVKELVEEKIGWHYRDTFHTDVIDAMCDASRHGIIPDEPHYFTNFMYNDISDDDLGFIGDPEQNKERWRSEILFSGEAQCMWCGDYIEFNDNTEDADTLGCCGHRDEWVCEDCGHTMEDEDMVWYGPNGEVWCEDCYHEHIKECDECGRAEYKEHTYTINLPVTTKVAKSWYEKVKDHTDRHPLSFLVFHGWWNDETRFDEPHTEQRCLCQHCMDVKQSQWRDSNTRERMKIYFINATTKRDLNNGFSDEEYDARYNVNNFTIDATRTDFAAAMQFMQPKGWERAHRFNAPADWRDTVRIYYKEQYEALAKAIADSRSNYPDGAENGRYYI